MFCKSCVAEYFAVRINDGSVKNICCPEENCTSEALPSQVGVSSVYSRVYGMCCVLGEDVFQ